MRGYGVDATVDECVQLIRQYDDTTLGKLDLYSFAALLDDLHDGVLAAPWTPRATRPLVPLHPVSPPISPSISPSRRTSRFPRPRYHQAYPGADDIVAPRAYARVPYSRPLLPSSIQAIFERCDGACALARFRAHLRACSWAHPLAPPCAWLGKAGRHARGCRGRPHGVYTMGDGRGSRTW